MRYHNITKDDMKNGDGLRVVLWVAGCPHACKGCHNPVTWDINDGLIFDESAKKEIFDELEHSYTSGLTLSGGDPLHPVHREEIGSLIDEVKQRFPDKTIWLYTGYLYEEVKDLPYLKKVDVVVDGPFLLEEFDAQVKWKGSRNQRVIDVPATLKSGEVVLKYTNAK